MAEVAATSQSNVLLERISPVTELEVSHVESIERETVDKFFSAGCGCNMVLTMQAAQFFSVGTWQLLQEMTAFS